jgi:hypothetical protein
MIPEADTQAIRAADPLFRANPMGALAMRVLSLLGLAGTLLGVAYVGNVIYRLLTDSFVAPIILSRDSDMVIQSKLNLSRLLAERDALVGRIAENDAAIEASERAVERLKELRSAAERTLEWSVALTGQQSRIGARDAETLAAQRAVISKMIEDQERVVAELHAHLSQGMVHKTELEREEVALNQMRVASLDNERNRLANAAQRQAAGMAQRSLQNPTAAGVAPTPEVVAHQDQLVKLDLEVLKLEAEARGKRVQRTTDEGQLTKIDQLVGEMKVRPIFRAIESNQNVAFVPYTQIDGVAPGGAVYHCKLWGLFLCRTAGRVSELVPGEVLAQDPWGTPMRGRYSMLELNDPRVAESQSLRVRLEPNIWRDLGARLGRFGH